MAVGKKIIDFQKHQNLEYFLIQIQPNTTRPQGRNIAETLLKMIEDTYTYHVSEWEDSMS